MAQLNVGFNATLNYITTMVPTLDPGMTTDDNYVAPDNITPKHIETMENKKRELQYLKGTKEAKLSVALQNLKDTGNELAKQQYRIEVAKLCMKRKAEANPEPQTPQRRSGVSRTVPGAPQKRRRVRRTDPCSSMETAFEDEEN